MHRLFLALTACAVLATSLPAQAITLPAAGGLPAAAADTAGTNPLVLDVRYHHHHHRHHHPHA